MESMLTMKPIRVMIVDDHALFRRGLRSILLENSEFIVCGEAKNGIEACQMAEQFQPDVILMDINMPGMDGVEAVRKIMALNPAMKIIMLTFQEDEEYLFEAVKSGARGYLLKDLDPDEIFGYVQGVMLGEAPISKTMASKMLIEFANRSNKVCAGTNKDTKELSMREKDVLRMVAQGATNKEIGASLHISENTVKNHLRNILDKLQLDNRVQAAAFAMRNGII